jgi:hypothetical protein
MLQTLRGSRLRRALNANLVCLGSSEGQWDPLEDSEQRKYLVHSGSSQKVGAEARV